MSVKTLQFHGYTDRSKPRKSYGSMEVKSRSRTVTPLAKLLVSFPDEHPVVSSYKSFFTDSPTAEDNRVDTWLIEPLWNPVEELTALMVRPLERLQDFRLVEVPGLERRRRVLTVGRVMLQLLALQYELEEPLNLNGDTFDDLVERAIEPVHLESNKALRAMIVATKPKQLRHKKHWDKEAFADFIRDFYANHTVFDSTFRPKTYMCYIPQETRRPPIEFDILSHTEDEVQGRLSTKSRSRMDGEDTPAPKRQKMIRQLRPRGSRGPRKEQVVANPVGTVVAKGKGWITIEVDDSGS
ncbi:hypothetical protein B0H11DRAFT_1919781 [Mycena galericulata]|nr:hypothetical protein B0H11DRAFT_1919781 [Mycena galericulata]